VKTFLGVVAGLAALVFLRLVVSDHDNLFVAAEAVHAIGISVLIYKLTKEKNCAGKLHSPPPPAHQQKVLCRSFAEGAVVCRVQLFAQ